MVVALFYHSSIFFVMVEVYGFRLGEERFFHANAATLPARAHTHRTVAQ